VARSLLQKLIYIEVVEIPDCLSEGNGREPRGLRGELREGVERRFQYGFYIATFKEVRIVASYRAIEGCLGRRSGMWSRY
jgi:hypothetical protein